MSRILLVDDSPSARRVTGLNLRDLGHDVEDVGDAVTAMERALTEPPDIVVTDLSMPGISGVQLCRLLKADSMTTRIPVILLTASDNRKSRFWARSAGATAYVTKTRFEELAGVVAEVLAGATEKRAKDGPGSSPPKPDRHRPRGTVPERLSTLLDTALFESVILGEVRALSHTDGDAEKMFIDLARITADVISYRWLALTLGTDEIVFLHTRTSTRTQSELEARNALGLPDSTPIVAVEDDRALDGSGPIPIVQAVRFGSLEVGRLGLGPNPRGVSTDDVHMLNLLSTEVGGPVRMLTLVREARHLAATDLLTGLMNRRAFIESMDRERSRSERHGFPTSLVMLDVDLFKRVNDSLGHAAGDAILRGVAQVLRTIARKSDIVGRWGGEEFIIALPQTSEAGARVAAERIRRAISEAKMALPDGGTHSITASLGVACEVMPWELDTMTARADEALYLAKSRGRNRVEMAQRSRPSEPPPGTTNR